MSFSNIKSFIKEYWAAFMTFLLETGQVYLFIFLVQQTPRWLKHSDEMNYIFLTTLGGCWLLILGLFPTVIISYQVATIKRLQAEKKTAKGEE